MLRLVSPLQGHGRRSTAERLHVAEDQLLERVLSVPIRGARRKRLHRLAANIPLEASQMTP